MITGQTLWSIFDKLAYLFNTWREELLKIKLTDRFPAVSAGSTNYFQVCVQKLWLLISDTTKNCFEMVLSFWNVYSKWSNVSINYTIEQCIKQWKGCMKGCNCELVFTFITYLATEWDKIISTGVFFIDNKFKLHSICFGRRKAQRIWWASI